MRCNTCRVSPWFSVCDNDDLFVLRFKGAHEIKPCLLIWLGTAEAEDEQMAMGVCAGESLAIRGEFAVENRSMTLALNLDEKTQNHTIYEKLVSLPTRISTEVEFVTIIHHSMGPCMILSLPAGPSSRFMR